MNFECIRDQHGGFGNAYALCGPFFVREKQADSGMISFTFNYRDKDFGAQLRISYTVYPIAILKATIRSFFRHSIRRKRLVV